MMRDIHGSKYVQAIPGVNRIDDELRLTSAEKCVDQFGEGLPMPQRLLADAATAHQRGRHTKVWCEKTSAMGERAVREAFRKRDDKLAQWRAHLNEEVDRLAREMEAVDEAGREAGKRRQHASDVRRAADMTADFRRRLPEHDDDDIDRLVKEEKNATFKADEIAQQCSKDLKECKRKMSDVRLALMAEAEAKASALNVNRRCQHSEPLLSFPACRPPPSNTNSEEEWERRLENMLRDSSAARQEASLCRLRAASSLQEVTSSIEEARDRTTRALEEEVARDERRQHDARNTLEEIGREILWTKQRFASLLDDLKIQDKARTLQEWRLDTLACRPHQDRIRDAPNNRCEEEVANVQKREGFVCEGADRNRALLGRLQEEKGRRALLLDALSKKLFVERENCLGLRRTVARNCNS